MDEKVVEFTRIFAENQVAKPTVVINVGGARSSKSYSLAQLFITKFLTEKRKVFGICRKTFPSLRMTAMLTVLELLREYGAYEESRHNKTFNTYERYCEWDERGKPIAQNRIQFFGLDESEKIKSTEFNYIWMEEANEFTYEDYTNFKLRLSGKTTPDCPNHLYLSLNPVDSNNWIPTRAAKEEDVVVIKSTFLDNPFLSPAYKKLLTDLIYQDENYYRIYALGEWGKAEGRIYKNYKVLPKMPELPPETKWAYGLDFGLVNPSAIVKVSLVEDKFYVEELLYRSGMTTADIIEFLSHQPRADIFGDPSAKMMIEEIYRAGYTAYEGLKGVREGIDLCQRQTLYIPQDSANLIKEIQNYSWKKDPNSEGFLSEPVKFNDHAVDAMRYAIWGLTERYGFATKRPGPVKPISTLTFRKPKRINWR